MAPPVSPCGASRVKMAAPALPKCTTTRRTIARSPELIPVSNSATVSSIVRSQDSDCEIDAPRARRSDTETTTSSRSDCEPSKLFHSKPCSQRRAGFHNDAPRFPALAQGRGPACGIVAKAQVLIIQEQQVRVGFFRACWRWRRRRAGRLGSQQLADSPYALAASNRPFVQRPQRV